MADSETTEETEQAAPRSRSERIGRSIKRARKLSGPEYDENAGQVKFLLEEARILATLEVADALRDRHEGGATA